MNFQKAEFSMACGKLSQLPAADRMEIAFIGRSNVGKSTLINTLAGRKSLARVSAVPGKTATINFYGVEHIWLVDLPGYGYANASVEVKAKWGKMIERYLRQ